MGCVAFRNTNSIATSISLAYKLRPVPLCFMALAKSFNFKVCLEKVPEQLFSVRWSDTSVQLTHADIFQRKSRNEQASKRASKQTNKQGDKTNKRGVGMWDALHTMHFEIANAQMNHFFDFRNPCNTRNQPHHSLKSILRRNPLHSKCITGTDCTSGHPMDLAVPLPCWPGTMKKSVPAIHAPLVSQNHSQDSIASPRVKCLDVCCQVQLDRFGNEQPLIKIWKSELNTYYAFVHRKKSHACLLVCIHTYPYVFASPYR